MDIHGQSISHSIVSTRPFRSFTALLLMRALRHRAMDTRLPVFDGLTMGFRWIDYGKYYGNTMKDVQDAWSECRRLQFLAFGNSAWVNASASAREGCSSMAKAGLGRANQRSLPSRDADLIKLHHLSFQYRQGMIQIASHVLQLSVDEHR